MSKRILAALLTAALCLTFFSCKNDEFENTTDEESISEETTDENENTTDEHSSEKPANSVSIKFSSARAKLIGTFDSDIYGKMFLYLQDGYFLIFNEFESHIFTIWAENYSPVKEKENNVISADMNFDGKTDFGVCYYADSLNSYYFCFIWDGENKTYNYFLPLSSIANPEFYRSTRTVIENKKLTFTEIVRNRYSVSESGLTLIATENVEEEGTTSGKIGNEMINPEYSCMENGNSALLSVKAASADMKWICFIENENVVSLASSNYDNISKFYEFLISASSEGATTVILRYMTQNTEDVIQEINLNVYVTADNNVSVIVP